MTSTIKSTMASGVLGFGVCVVMKYEINAPAALTVAALIKVPPMSTHRMFGFAITPSDEGMLILSMMTDIISPLWPQTGYQWCFF